MMKRFWAFASAYKRNLVVASYKSAHYPGVKSVDICMYFNLPADIKCTDARRNVLVNEFNCSIAPQEQCKPIIKCFYSNLRKTILNIQ